MIKQSIFFLTFFLSLTIFGQTNYSVFVRHDQINKKQIISSKDGSSEEIIYLGEIKNKSGQTIYYVLSVYRLVQAAIEKHGHSNVIFLDYDLKVKKQYELDLPEELPFKLENNILNFYYFDTKTKVRRVYQNKIEIELPKILCVSPNNCF